MLPERVPLTPSEKILVGGIYKRMAEILVNKSDERGNPGKYVLANNRYVELELANCLDDVSGNGDLLIEIWRLWVKGRELEGLRYPVTKFRTEMSGLVSTAAEELRFKRIEDERTAREAKRKVGRS
jgi:hypothetical protein